MEIMKHALVLAKSVPNRHCSPMRPKIVSPVGQTSPNPTIMPRRISIHPRSDRGDFSTQSRFA